MATPLLFEIKGNSLDDGPGIRTVLFFKGCPLDCAWCHNPEGRRPQAELSFDAHACVGAGDCIRRCPEGALDRTLPGFVDRARCTLCFDCVPACPAGALSRVGLELDVDAIVEKTRRDLPFFRASGGGVTLSGGEPAMYAEFAGRVARGLKTMGVHVLLETCGHFDRAGFDRHLAPWVDLVYFDLKIFDPDEHRRLCGVDNRRIIENFKVLNRRAIEGGTPLLARVPLIPGMTATGANLTAIANLLRAEGAGRVALLPYNPLWPDKLGRLGLAAPERSGALGRFMTAEEIARCRGCFAGIPVE